jgi:hypothetical protein
MRYAVVVAALLSAGGLVYADELEQRTAGSRALAQEFGAALKKELTTAIQADGPVAAIGVCNEKAPGIAQSLSERQGWEVGRTALKFRNPENAPDDWEREVLNRFEAARAGGASPGTLEFAERVQTENGPVFRYMKAIPTGELCLVCHGAALSPEVSAKLQTLYPDDRATGFRVGDIRGAFTITQPE